MRPTVVLAFSGGLDTSFCVPYLTDLGYEVVTLFVDTGGVDAEKRQQIERRAHELGASGHVVRDASMELWGSIVAPFIMGGVLYQDQYPILCSDRYLIAVALAELADELGADAVAHGCTGMGNDQVRLDQSLRCLTERAILAPIREIQSRTDSLRAYEIAQLLARGVRVQEDVRRYTINEDLLGATISGAEIDTFQRPSDDTWRLTASRSAWPADTLQVEIGFEEGRAVALDGVATPGPALLAQLNAIFGAYGVGRGVYTGDTIIGLKGRIVFEAPGLTALLTAHRALEETVLTKAQSSFKPMAARRWTDLVYAGLYFDPLRTDLEAFIRSTQRRVTGVVTLETAGGSCLATAVDSPNALIRPDATYAQRADWTKSDAEGFIKLYGLSSAIAVGVASRAETSSGKVEPPCLTAS